MGKQICTILFQRDFLLEYTRMLPTSLEVADSVNLMRVLEHGLKVRLAPTRHDTQAVGAPQDLAKVEKLIAG